METGSSRLPPPPPSHRNRTPFRVVVLIPPERGLFESICVSIPVSKKRNGAFCASVSSSKNPVPGGGERGVMRRPDGKAESLVSIADREFRSQREPTRLPQRGRLADCDYCYGGSWAKSSKGPASDTNVGVTTLAGIESEVLELLAPVRVGIAQALDIDAAGQAPFDGSLDKFRSKECERERQVDLT